MTWLDHATGLIKKWEGCKLHAYPDPATGAEPWTVGYGATGDGIGPDTVWTQEQADADLEQRLFAANMQITRAVRVRLTPQQRAALVSLVYNIGFSNFLSSTLLKRLNAGDYQGAADEFLRWNKAAGKPMAGLIARRAEERALFLET